MKFITRLAKIPFTLNLVLLVVSFPTQICQSQARVTAAVSFLLEPPDARCKGMAESGSVFSKGAVSAFYNPANLVGGKGISAEFGYCKLMPEIADNITYKSLYLSGPIGRWLNWGVSYARLSYGHYEWYHGGDNSVDKFDPYDAVYGLSIATSFDKNSSVGASVKYIYSDVIPELNGSSYAFDFGLKLRNQFPNATFGKDEVTFPILRKYFRSRDDKGISLGISILNWGPGITYLENYSPHPLSRNLRFAAGYQIVDIDHLGLRLTLDATKLLIDTDNDFGEELEEIDWSWGVEATLFYLITLRAGRHFSEYAYNSYTAIGIGLGPEWLSFDYSRILANPDEVTRGGQNAISISANLRPGMFR